MALGIGLLIVCLASMLFFGFLLIYSGGRDDSDEDIEQTKNTKCRQCKFYDVMFGCCGMTNAHVKPNQDCNLSDELERIKNLKNRKGN